MVPSACRILFAGLSVGFAARPRHNDLEAVRFFFPVKMYWRAPVVSPKKIEKRGPSSWRDWGHKARADPTNFYSI